MDVALAQNTTPSHIPTYIKCVLPIGGTHFAYLPINQQDTFHGVYLDAFLQMQEMRELCIKSTFYDTHCNPPIGWAKNTG